LRVRHVTDNFLDKQEGIQLRYHTREIYEKSLCTNCNIKIIMPGTNCEISQIENKHALYFEFSNHVFNAGGWSVRPKHVAYIDETNKLCCG